MNQRFLPVTPTRERLIRAIGFLAFVWLLPVGVSAHGDFDERIEAASRAVAADPNNPEPRLVRAELHRRHGDFAAALHDLDAAGSFAPELVSINYFRGLVFLDAGRSAEAEATLRRFLEQEPNHPAGHEARARALIQLDRPLEAAREYDLVVAQQPVPVPDYYVARALAFAAAGDAHLDEAIRGLDAGVAAIGSIVTLERVSIDLELRRGATDAALARLEQIAARSPRSETWLALRGNILSQLGRNEEAKESFALALAQLDQISPTRRRAPATSRLESEIRESLTALAALQSEGEP